MLIWCITCAGLRPSLPLPSYTVIHRRGTCTHRYANPYFNRKLPGGRSPQVKCGLSRSERLPILFVTPYCMQGLEFIFWCIAGQIHKPMR